MQTSSEGNNFLRKKYTSSVAFLVGVLLFLLPFVEIRCNNTPFAQNTGVGLAFGIDYKITGQMKSLDDTFSGSEAKVSKEKGKMYIAALIAFILGLIGLILSLINTRSHAINMVIATLAAIALIILMVQLKTEVKDKTVLDEPSNSIKVTVNFTAWYYLSVISFLAAAFFSFKKGQFASIHEQPPKQAPQVPIENPGEQSEFPKSPSESDIG